MQKRVIIFFSVMMFCICFSIFRLYSISNEETLQSASVNHGSYKLNVTSNRGNIYDCRKIPLVDLQENTIAAVMPSIKTPAALSKLLSAQEISDILPLLKLGKPFCVNIKDEMDPLYCRDVKTFKVPKRYSDNQLAGHIIGYLNSSGNGVCGIEKAFDEYLNNSKGYINLVYKTDALGRIMCKNNIIVEDTMYKKTSGVVLTIDKRIQEIAELASEKYLKKGAIVVVEVPNCEIRACVSVPSFSVENIKDALNNEDSPLLNRAILPYNVGSVFKLVTAAVALDDGILPENKFTCTGSIEIDNATFHCSGGKPHADVDIISALAFSCNSYFVNLIRQIDPQKFWELSSNLGFGKSLELAPNMFSSAGNLPDVELFKDTRSLANLSFGQGTLTATPIQIAGLINTVASGGKYSVPRLVVGVVDENLEYTNKTVYPPATQLFSSNTANILKSGMCSSIEYGTGTLGKPSNCCAAAKTGTAQTGIKVGDRFLLQAWYAGFYPANTPKYAIVALAEDSNSGGQACGPIFKKIVDEIYNNIY